MKVFEAQLSDCDQLTEITLESKAHWGYNAEQMSRWKDELTITPEYMVEYTVLALEIGFSIAGYCSYKMETEDTAYLDNLFIRPSFIGRGLDVFLIEDFISRLKQTETKRVVLYSDPHAEAFYRKMGFVTTGKIETSIAGRTLPQMERDVF